MQKEMTSGRLLDQNGRLAECGYATSLVRAYSRSDIRAKKRRIKEWDYYLVYNERFGVALTIDDNSYMGLLSVSVLDFVNGTEKTKSIIKPFTRGKTDLPPDSSKGRSFSKSGKSTFSFDTKDGERRLIVHCDGFDGDAPFDCDILLTDGPKDSMVIATPFAEDPTAFYYNQKILAMRANGWAAVGGSRLVFDPEESFGLLDWGRGVWTYDNTWYWGAGHGVSNGHRIAFNLGYGFGDTSAATENMVFFDGIAHKLQNVDFGIPKNSGGSDDLMSEWHFTSDDGRFEGIFTPILDRRSLTSVKIIESDQHQVFGRMNGHFILDDGSRIALSNFLCFADKVRNKW